MSTKKPRPLLRIEYEESAEAYLRSLPIEHFKEATAAEAIHFGSRF